MARFCDDLKNERESRGITLEAISAEMKVNLRHLSALEAGKFEALPGGVIRRGIVRAYLAAVGLDEGAWLERFQASFEEYARASGLEASSGNDAWEDFARNVRRNQQAGRPGRQVRWLGVVALLLLVLAAAWAAWKYVLQGRMGR